MAATEVQLCRYRLGRVGIGMFQFGLWSDDDRCLLESGTLLTVDGALRAIERTRAASSREDRYWWRIARDQRQQIVLLDDDGLFLCASPRGDSRSALEATLALMQRWGPNAELCIAPAGGHTATAGDGASRESSGRERRQHADTSGDGQSDD